MYRGEWDKMLGTNMLAVAEETATPEKEVMDWFLFRGGFLDRADHLSSQSLSFLQPKSFIFTFVV